MSGNVFGVNFSGNIWRGKSMHYIVANVVLSLKSRTVVSMCLSSAWYYLEVTFS
jgi:hypothetical protein